MMYWSFWQNSIRLMTQKVRSEFGYPWPRIPDIWPRPGPSLRKKTCESSYDPNWTNKDFIERSKLENYFKLGNHLRLWLTPVESISSFFRLSVWDSSGKILGNTFGEIGESGDKWNIQNFAWNGTRKKWEKFIRTLIILA
jgi:hypothetical protein